MKEKMNNMKLAGQFALATAVFAGTATVVHKCFAGPPPQYAHFPTHFLPSAILIGMTGILAIATFCVFAGAIIERIGKP